MKLDDATIKKILLDGSYVTADDISAAEKYAAEHRGSFLDYLLSEELLSESILGQAIAESYRVPYADLKARQPSQEQVRLIPEKIAKKFRIILFKQDKNSINIATDDPTQKEIATTIKAIFPKQKITVSFSLSGDIDAALTQYRQDLKTSFATITKEGGRTAPEIIDQILEDALSLKSSDVHFEPEEKSVVVRFRIDGVLHDAGEIPREYYENIVNRLKVQAKLRIDEHFGTQDGAIRYISPVRQHPIDLRISIVPTMDGEKIAVRILSSYVRELGLSDIGLSQKFQEQILKSIAKPFGMILVTGPTGSGKTTTLYSLIKILNTRGTNITTIEDPVEYKIQGVNQIQINPQASLTFAKGLRAIMRQDPNTILVGEIRDLETADIAVNAALTGHLLLSTFHANNAATAIPRFIDMGIEPFLLGSTLEMIIAQRLVRKICDNCKVSYKPSKTEMNNYPKEVVSQLKTTTSLYKGKGCPICSGTGYRGRVGVFEYLSSTPELQDMIARRPSAKDIAVLIKSKQFISMFDDGMEKVKTGETTVDEVLRVVGVS